MALPLTPAGAASRPSTISLVDQTSWASAAAPFDLQLDIESGVDLQRLVVDVSVFPRLTSRSQFNRTLEDKISGNPLRRLTPKVPDLGVDARGARTMSFLPGQVDQGAGRPITRAGVYPVRVELRDSVADKRLDGFVTHMVVVPPQVTGSPLDVALILPLAGRPSIKTSLEEDTEAVTANAARFNGIITTISSHKTPVSLVIIPETLEGILNAGQKSKALAQVVEGLRKLAQQSPVISSTYVPVDLRAIGTDTGELERQADEGKDTLVNALGVVPDARLWFTGTNVGPNALSRLDELNVERVVLPDTSLAEDRAQRLTLTSPFVVEDKEKDSLDAMALDTGLRQHFRQPSPLKAHHLMADLAVIYFDQPGGATPRSVIVAPGLGWTPEGTFLEILLRDMATSPVLKAQTVDALFDRSSSTRHRPVVRRLKADSPSPLTASTTSALRAKVEAFSNVLETSNPLRRRTETALLLSQSTLLSRKERAAFSQGTDKTIQSVLEAITLPSDRAIRLTAKAGNMPVAVRNSTGYPIRARITVEGPRLSFPEGNSRDLVLDREITTSRFLVQARTSGAFPITVRLTSRDGSLLLAESTVTVRSTAVSNVGVFLSVGAITILLWWWGRHAYRRHSSHKSGHRYV